MVKIPDRINKIIKKYLFALKKNNIPVKKAILFGSYANGSNSKWSDIDLAIVSELFEGNRIDDRNKIRQITLSISSDLEVLPYKPEDFISDNPFVKEIMHSGIVFI